MKFSVSSSILCTRLQTISRAQNSKNSLAILDSILFELDGDELRLTASDSETTIVSTLTVCDADGAGKITIDSHQIINSIKEIPDQPITFTINDNTLEVEVNYQNGKYKLIAQNGDEFPLPAQNMGISSQLVVPSQLLLNGLSRCLFATADDELRPQMNGVFFDITTDMTTLVASDGHKLVRNRLLNIKGEQNASFVLPKKPINLLKSILAKEEEDVTIDFQDRSANIYVAGYQVICRLIDGRYPNYNSVIPQDNPFCVRIDRQALISVLRRVSVFASTSSSLVKLQLDSNSMIVSAQDIDYSTSAEERLICEYEGNPMAIGFNCPFLLEVLNNISGQDIILELADPSRAGVVVPADNNEGEDLVMLLMPMMLQD